MDRSIAALLDAASLAPSGDNTQPWRFVVDPEARTIALGVDATRDPSPMNAGGRMARIAVGAALENLVRAARARGWAADLEWPDGPDPVLVRLAPGDAPANPADGAVAARVTNRRPYERRPVPDDVLGRLIGATPEIDGIATHWIVERGRLDALARLIGRADATMFGEPSMRRAFLAKVRLDATPDAPAVEGLCPASLELSALDRWAIRTIRSSPDWLFRAAGAARAFESKARTLVRRSSGLCLIVAPDDRAATDFLVGRAMQRAWLALTAEGLAAQPMMSLLVLENAAEHGDARLLDALGRGRLASLRDEFRALAPEIGGGRPAFLLRFGHAPKPSGRTGRLPIDAVASGQAAPHRRPAREGSTHV